MSDKFPATSQVQIVSLEKRLDIRDRHIDALKAEKAELVQFVMDHIDAHYGWDALECRCQGCEKARALLKKVKP